MKWPTETGRVRSRKWGVEEGGGGVNTFCDWEDTWCKGVRFALLSSGLRRSQRLPPLLPQENFKWLIFFPNRNS